MNKLIFHRRSMPIIASYRPLYKISWILLIMKYSSRGGRSSIIRLHLFNWAMKEDKRKALLIKASKTGDLNVDVWGIDPALTIAIEFAHAEGLVERDIANYKITYKGKGFVERLIKEDLFANDVAFLKEIGLSITEEIVQKAAKKWG